MPTIKLPTIKLTYDVRQTLARGVGRLRESGRRDELEMATRIQVMMVRDHGLVWDGGHWISTSDAYEGWARVPGVPDAVISVVHTGGRWIGGYKSKPVRYIADFDLYYDEECSILLRTVRLS